MSGLLGCSIDNTSEHHQVIAVKVGVCENLNSLKDRVSQQIE